MGLVLLAFGIEWAASDPGPGDAPIGSFLLAIIVAAAAFDRGSGYVATAFALALSAFVILPDGFGLPSARDTLILIVFAAVGITITAIVEALHRTIERLAATNEALSRSERARGLLLAEFRHRTRNDLGALVGLLLLRARGAPSETAAEALREAAGHALALARVHARLTPGDAVPPEHEGWVDTREFITGLCADIGQATAGEGLRPVAVTAAVEPHALDTERAVTLGLVLNEAVTNALKYAFPEDRAGTVRVGFVREGEDFVLSIGDDGVGLPSDAASEGRVLPAGSGLGTRLLQGMAAQLRGAFTRHGGEEGTLATLRFPAARPGT